MTMTLFDMRKNTILKWAVPVLMALLLAMAVGCGGDDERIPAAPAPPAPAATTPPVRVVEVEVPTESDNSEMEALRKELESLKEALEESKTGGQGSGMSGTGAASASPTPRPTPRPTATPVVNTKSVLFVTDRSEDWTQMSALAFANGIETEFLSDSLSSGVNFLFRLNRANSLYIVMRTPDREVGYGQLKLIRDFISDGGKAVIFVIRCDSSEDLRDTIGVSCAKAGLGRLRDNGQGTLRVGGEHFSPLWRGLYVMDECPEACVVGVEFFAGNSGDFECIAAIGTDKGNICTALHGTIGEGELMLMSDAFLAGSYYDHWFYDRRINFGDNKDAGLRLLQWLVERDEPSARESQSGDSVTLPGGSFDAASLLARFSTTFISSEEGEKRANAVGHILAEHRSGNTNTERVIDLLHIISPELSITARRQAAANLANLSENDKWDEEDTAEGVFYLASVITGDEPNPGERMEAAYEMVVLYEAGELDAEQGLDLLDTIAPSLGVNERRQAAAALARLSADDDWNDADRMEAASEVFRLVTGVPLAAEQRIGATVDLAGVGVKIFGDDQFDDEEITTATTVIKQALTGELTTESLQDLLGFGN